MKAILIVGSTVIEWQSGNFCRTFCLKYAWICCTLVPFRRKSTNCGFVTYCIERTAGRTIQAMPFWIGNMFYSHDSIWSCFLYIVMYWCDVPEGKEMLAMRYWTLIERLCIFCMVAAEIFKNVSPCSPREMKHTVKTRVKVKPITTNCSNTGNKGSNAKQTEF